jgi:hypothetical protein
MAGRASRPGFMRGLYLEQIAFTGLAILFGEALSYL